MNISRMEHRSSLRVGKEHPEYPVFGEIKPMQRFSVTPYSKENHWQEGSTVASKSHSLSKEAENSRPF